jgi:hypothetical protein
MEDIESNKKTCITSIDEQGQLLKEKPKDWNKI